MMKQMILITDGCSNVGISPVVAAANAYSEGIVVNVIGVIDHGEFGEYGAREIAEIAHAGGGMSRIVSTRMIAQTVQMMTRKTVAHTIQQAVNEQLRQIMGHDSIEHLPPDKREQVVRVVDDLAETSPLRIVLLIDASASMKPKLRAVEEAVRDLALSLQAREGASEIAVLHFPGTSGNEVEVDAPWTADVAKIGNLFYKLNMKGATPTGPAMLQAVHYFACGEPYKERTDGMLSDYIV